ncbi:ATP-binding protein [Sediminibacterium ginsengisoli]|uniref:Uncharacterized protein YPO0396 n=1 Tax=Sediminibacterium ginsengisoli TaxID=413434 RepID=A0A1T4P0J0_9BACT|nr:SbcC/MukB-like Walker B domain-containing protein [Sediminibacterium ginsengisoli]SJZ85003.1 Uncharacterized protein YPO0396 [Sediminibacterium ginsengisoli]
MQLDVFNTDIHKTGFRLQYMEVFNWGTFDNEVHAIKPMGETSLLTGLNGSGKTTFIDALLTLLVPEKKYRFYNQSSGSEKKDDRTEDSYVRGGYSFMNSEATSNTVTLYLRENKDEAYSILLVNFANEIDHQVTLFQVRYYNNGELKKVYGLAHKPLHVVDDFKPFDLNGNWKKRIDQVYNRGARKQVEWFDTANKYAQRIVDALGLQSIQALPLFNQIVGIKVLDNLDDFIRKHMLEPRNTEDQFQELKKHLSTLLEAQLTIEKTEAQIRLLQNLDEHYQKFSVADQDRLKHTQTLELLKIWNSFTKDHLLDQAIADANRNITSLTQKIETAEEDLIKLREEERKTINLVDNNKAGQKLIELENQIESTKKEHFRVEQVLEQFKQWMDTLHIKEEPTDETTYLRIVKEAGRIHLKLVTEQRINEEDDFQAKETLKTSTNEKNDLEQEIEMLHQSKTNIPYNLVQLRKELCSALKIDTDELPFVGELVQVHASELSWQPALEKLLRSYAMRMLIPDKYYKKATSYINTQNLRNRIVYNHVTDSALIQHADQHTIIHKLEFHPDHKLSHYVEQLFIQQFSYVAVDDEKTMQRYDKAITINGLIKSGVRHEKDDRPNQNDPSKYVMGWNSEKKKEALIARRMKLQDLIQRSNETINSCQNKSNRIQRQFIAIERIKEITSFDQINSNAIQQSIHKIEKQVTALRKDNKQLDTLKQQLTDIGKQITATSLNADELKEERTKCSMRIEQMTGSKEELNLLLSKLTEEDKDKLLTFQAEYSSIIGNATLDTIDAIYREFKTKVEGLKENAVTECNTQRNQVYRNITRIKYPSPELAQKFPTWISDVQPFSDSAEHAQEYIEWLEKLSTENLPKYKKEFENFINVTITHKIGVLREDMDKWERDITNTINKLNQSLQGINFNRLPDTYIQLEKQPVKAGTDQKEFQKLLLDALPQAANWANSSFEDKSLHFTQKVKPLIDKLDQSEAYRNKVMDVRNWFEFWANELYKHTGESKKAYRQMGQLSGGEKPQLTYTILCSAIAYQFGITKDAKNNRSLRFIAVDESFSNQDEEKATYLMELCKQLHLQLLVVTPSDKIQIVQDFIAHVHLVQRVNNRHSVLYNMTIKELRDQMKQA